MICKGRQDVKILAIDPDRNKIKFIDELCKINNINNIITVISGVSDKKGFCSQSKVGHSGMWKINENTGDIPLNTLDNICKSLYIGLIHLDVERHEYKVLLGLQNIIHKYHPPIMLEYYGDSNNLRIPQLMKKFKYKKIWSGEHNILYI